MAQAQEPAAASYAGISVENSRQLFAVMSALDAAGFDANVDTTSELRATSALRQQLLNLQGPSTDALRSFYREHQLADPGETLSRYISFALLAGPPPQFEFSIEHDLLPPDVLTVDGFQDVLVNFYRDARIDERWWTVAPEYAHEVEDAEGPVRHLLLISSSYLREIIHPVGQRTFTIYVEPLVGSRTNFRNYGDHYYLVVGRGRNLPLDEIRHAYLHFLLDPLPLRDRKLVIEKRDLLAIATRSPLLPPEYQSDFVSFFDECLIKAVELRLSRLSTDQLEGVLHEDDMEGYILVRPIMAQLKKFEKSEPSMDLYFPDLVRGIDVAAEQQRFQNFTFAAPAQPVKPHAPAKADQADQASELDTWLAEGDREIAMKDGNAAAATFDRTLKKYPDQPRAAYGLAIASILTGQGERARDLFEMLVSQNSHWQNLDPAILAWSHVYLGRIHDVEGERDLALTEYQAALNVNGAPEAARVAAQRGTAAAYRPSGETSQDSQKP